MKTSIEIHFRISGNDVCTLMRRINGKRSRWVNPNEYTKDLLLTDLQRFRDKREKGEKPTTDTEEERG